MVAQKKTKTPISDIKENTLDTGSNKETVVQKAEVQKAEVQKAEVQKAEVQKAGANKETVVQKAGANKKNVKKEPVTEPSVELVGELVAEPVAEPVVQKAGAKKSKKSTVENDETVPAKKVLKKTKETKKQLKKVNKSDETEVPEEELDGKTRSFKVKLPGSTNEEEFTGRFTGLTPYQAANKALSKFFRNNENNNLSSEPVIFSIKESTRGSKRHTYTYKGIRIKLDEAITYTIKSVTGEERVITKQYKNQLVKIKKGVAPIVSEQALANA
jgi:hypothetical protein